MFIGKLPPLKKEALIIALFKGNVIVPLLRDNDKGFIIEL